MWLWYVLELLLCVVVVLILVLAGVDCGSGSVFMLLYGVVGGRGLW